MTNFTIYTSENAPEKSREILRDFQQKIGFLPNILGEMAESPALLKGYKDLPFAASSGLFSPLELQVIQITTNILNNCTYCVAAHTTSAEKAGIEREILNNLREEKPLKDAKLEALRQFTIAMVKKFGWADERDLEAFLKAGWTKAHALEVILNISLKVMTNYINHLAKTPLDKAFEPNKFESKCRESCASHRAA